MTDQENSFDWNGTTINYGHWSDDAYGLYEYWTTSRRHFFVFDLQPVNGYVRIYIRQQPSYGSRATDGHSTHRHWDGNSHYVCVREDLQPDNVPDALSWAVYWAEQTGKYIDTGGSFS